jgi:hypothetical protein
MTKKLSRKQWKRFNDKLGQDIGDALGLPGTFRTDYAWLQIETEARRLRLVEQGKLPAHHARKEDLS